MVTSRPLRWRLLSLSIISVPPFAAGVLLRAVVLVPVLRVVVGVVAQVVLVAVAFAAVALIPRVTWAAVSDMSASAVHPEADLTLPRRVPMPTINNNCFSYRLADCSKCCRRVEADVNPRFPARVDLALDEGDAVEDRHR